MKFPIFTSYIELTSDPYWKKVFENCSKGRFPRKSGYDQNKNAIWFRDKDVHWYTLTENIEQDFEILKQNFQKYLKLKSQKDFKENRDQFNKLKLELDQSYIETWKDIKKKNIKDSLIRGYILKLQEEYELTTRETINLLKLIRQGILFGWINPNHIEYSKESRNIEDIKNLEYKDEKFVLKRGIVKYKREYHEPKEYLSSYWQKK